MKKIVGVGCGPGLLTQNAIVAISEATLIYGSDRAIRIARPFIAPECTVNIIEDYRSLSRLPEGAVILSTGDPMLAGLGYLDGEVIPGISSLQYAAARLKIPLSKISVVVAHGREHQRAIEETIAEIKRGKIVFLLPDPKFDNEILYQRLADLDERIQIVICENLSYPDERILWGDREFPPRLAMGRLFSIVIGHLLNS